MTNIKTFWFAFLISTACMAGTCTDSLYRGFDTRLNAVPIGRLPAGREQVVGFEIVHGKPIVAFSHRLLGFEKRRRISVFVEQEIEDLAVDNSGKLFVQLLAESGSSRLVTARVDAHLRPDPVLEGRVAGTLYNSGSTVFLEVNQNGSAAWEG
jgi:hypothetical protein